MDYLSRDTLSCLDDSLAWSDADAEDQFARMGEELERVT